MRQAGRYMAEYRVLREKHGMLELCRTPELACEVTMQPIRRFHMDAAIIFADILLPLPPMGIPFHFAQGEGPVIERPVRSDEDVRALTRFEVREALGYVLDAIRLTVAELPPEIPLIGFCGAPFTLASYMIEGGSSRNYLRAKQMMYSRPDLWHSLLEHISEILGEFLVAQAEAGARALQIFDSWVGALSPRDYAKYVQPHSRKVVEAARKAAVPLIHFGTGTCEILGAMREAGGDVIGLDWRVPLDEGWRRVGHDRAVQGNLDPTVLFAPEEVIREQVEDVMRRAEGRPGHIFNVGHGILPGTPLESLDVVIDAVRGYRR
jgi:uroporphyrinogen decarboxylase